MSIDFDPARHPDGFAMAMDRRSLGEQIKSAVTNLFVGKTQSVDTTASKEQGRTEEPQELSK